MAETILDEKIDMIAFSSYTATIVDLEKLCKKLKSKKDVTIIIGGQHATFTSQEILNWGTVDFVVRGEAEETMHELIKNISNSKKDFSTINGISFIKNNKIIHAPDRDFISNLDEIPFPARDLVSDKYYSIGKRLSILTSRGCVFNCIFCTSPYFWNRKVRFRSIENIVDEINLFFSQHPDLPTGFHINFVDDNITLKKERLSELCKELKKIGYPWVAYSSIGTINSQSAKEMKQSNCIRLKFGIESGNARILKLINKTQTLTQVTEVIQIVKKAGLQAHGTFIIGLPTETKNDVLDTINFACSLNLDIAYFFVATPYPGTGLMKYVDEAYNYISIKNDKLILPNFFGKNGKISTKEKKELLLKAYYDFYVKHKGRVVSELYYSESNFEKKFEMLLKTISKNNQILNKKQEHNNASKSN